MGFSINLVIVALVETGLFYDMDAVSLLPAFIRGFIDVDCPHGIPGMATSIQIEDPDTGSPITLRFTQRTTYEIVQARVVNANETIVKLQRLGATSKDHETFDLAVRGENPNNRAFHLCLQIKERHGGDCTITSRSVQTPS